MGPNAHDAAPPTEITLTPSSEPRSGTGNARAGTGAWGRLLAIVATAAAAVLATTLITVSEPDDAPAALEPRRPQTRIGLPTDGVVVGSAKTATEEASSIRASAEPTPSTRAPETVAEAYVAGWTQGQATPARHIRCDPPSHPTHRVVRCTSTGHTDTIRQAINPSWTYQVNYTVRLDDRAILGEPTRVIEDRHKEVLDAYLVWLFLSTDTVPQRIDCLAPAMSSHPVCSEAAENPDNIAAWLATSPQGLTSFDEDADPIVWN